MDVTLYSPPYNKANFYHFMGPFFAERIWQKKFPYLVNTPAKTWLIGKAAGQVCAFAAYQKVKKGIEIGEIYGSTELYWEKIANLILRNIKNENSYTLFTDIPKAEPFQLAFFEAKGFEVYKETQCYLFLKRSDDWKKRAFHS